MQGGNEDRKGEYKYLYTKGRCCDLETKTRYKKNCLLPGSIFMTQTNILHKCVFDWRRKRQTLGLL